MFKFSSNRVPKKNQKKKNKLKNTKISICKPCVGVWIDSNMKVCQDFNALHQPLADVVSGHTTNLCGHRSSFLTKNILNLVSTHIIMVSKVFWTA